MRRSEAPSQITSSENQQSVKRKLDPLDTLSQPFRVPFATPPSSNREQRKSRRQVNYKENFSIEGDVSDDVYSTRTPLSSKDVNRTIRVMDPETALTQNFTTPLKDRQEELSTRPRPSLGLCKRIDFAPRPLHDPQGELAIVLYDPTIDDEPEPVIEEVIETDNKTSEEKVMTTVLQYKRFQPSTVSLADILGIRKEKEKKHPKVPVVLDPKLSAVLRPHQVEGVQFMYKCVTGRVNPNVNGCIMADEMGLGKTLQCIALLWTLLKQSPEGNRGTIEKCIIACPASLVSNWANELVKWLGKGTVQPFAVDGKNSVKGIGSVSSAFRQWAVAAGRQVVRPVLIVSYETLRDNCNNLKNANIGLLLCDEGHRLKNSDNQTYKALNALDVSRRVILSGTPIQNDLKEYFSLLSFAIPGLVGSPTEFKRNYGNEITRGRDAEATEKDVEVGDRKLQELTKLVHPFIIRRTNDLLTKFLPRKYEHVVFCDMSPFQKELYRHFVQSNDVKKILRDEAKKSATGKKPTSSAGTTTLAAITSLKKLCNHPDLLELPDALEGSEKFFPPDYIPAHLRGMRDREVNTALSGKFAMLERMLFSIHSETNDKIVIISNYTETLNLVEKFCRNMKYGCLRLDGSMNIKKRQKFVDQFNNPESPEFIFLLSSKAGGCGINLIGANRLILLDPDWNPASDQQALARVWRDGQKKHCFVYRFIATGTIEEKIYQRQTMKQSLSSCVVDEKEDVERVFSSQDLRKLFIYNEATTCETHDTFKCKRCKKDTGQFVKAPATLYGDPTSWNHFTKGQLPKIEDELLRQEAENDVVNFVFQYISH